jgi:hypothetical protein
MNTFMVFIPVCFLNLPMITLFKNILEDFTEV